MAASFNANGNLTSITPPGKPAHNFIYNNVDLTESYTPPLLPDTTGTSYVYNFDKQLTHIIRPDNETVVFEYDTSGCGCSGVSKPKSILFYRGATLFAYSPSTGNLTSVVSPDSITTSFSYDGSLPTQLNWSGIVNGTVGVTYNNDFQIVSQTLTSAGGGQDDTNTIAFSYDDDGLLTNAGDLSISYNSQNGLLNGTMIDSVTDTYSYNNFGEMSNYDAKFGGTYLFNTVFERDSIGRIITKTETVLGAANKYDYKYNSIGYLIEVERKDTLISKYEYDDNGNRTKFISLNEQTALYDTVTADYDNQDRLLRYGNTFYNYTPNGELKSKAEGTDTTKYNYDNFGNLTKVVLPNGTLIEYIIDGQNRRVAKKVNGVIENRWLYQDQLNPVAEIDSAGNIITRYIYGSRINVPDYAIKGDTTYKIISDRLGSVRMVVNTVTSQIVQRIDYDEFGNIKLNTNPDFQPFGYAGGMYDDATKLVRFGARDYDSYTGRWTSKDPILFAGGLSNIYEYVANDPINKIDVNGLQDIFVFGEIDLVGITGIEAAVGLTLDIDNLGESGYTGSFGYAAGANAGAGVGLGFTLRESEGVSTNLDVNILAFSGTLMFDDKGFNGLALSFGPGVGFSVSGIETGTFSLNDLTNFIINFMKKGIASPCD